MESDLKGALDVFARLKSLLHELGRVPDLSTDKLEGIGAMSGSRSASCTGRCSSSPATKHGTYGDALEEANRRMLAVAAWREYDPTLEVQIKWVDALPSDQLEEAPSAEAKQRLGVSKHTLIEELGYDPELEAERRKDEADASMENVHGVRPRRPGGGSSSSSGDDNKDTGASDGANAEVGTVADFVFNIAKGKLKYYAELPAANDALIVIPLEAAGLEADATLKDYDDVAALIAGTTNEQTTSGRKTVTGVTVTVDDTNDRVDFDFADQTWAASTGNAVGALLIAYDPDTTGGTDSSLVPLVKLDFAVTPDGTDIVFQLNTAGFARAS
jgi:hypothetical protein